MVDGGDIIELLLRLGGGDIMELLLLDVGDMLLDNDDFDNIAMEPRKVAFHFWYDGGLAKENVCR